MISDTHLRRGDERLGLMLAKPFADAELVLHAGDLVDLAVLELFGGRQVWAVCGNADPLSVRQALPAEQVLDVQGFRLVMRHSLDFLPPRDRTLQERYGKVDCLICGHTHRPFRGYEGGMLCFNPGSATANRFLPFNTVGLLTIGETIEGEIVELFEGGASGSTPRSPGEGTGPF